MNLVKSSAMLLSCLLTYILNVTMATSQDHISMEQFDSFDENVSVLKKSDSIKPVKLTMKQGLVMNQVIATYALNDPRSSSCRRHVDDFKKGLRALEPWALQMFDSSSKLQFGILMGNLIEYGAFKQCLRIYKETENGHILGKHCTFQIIPGMKLVKTVVGFRNVSEKRFDKIKSSVLEGVRLIWSVCVPDSCPADDVFRHFNKTIMELVEGLEITVKLSEDDCESLLTLPEWTSKEYFYLTLAGSIIFIVFSCTFIDFMKGNDGESNQFVKIFSAISNGKRLLSKKTNQLELNCLHGIRFISVCYVMFGHRFMTGMLFPSINSLDLIDWILKYTSTVIIGGTVCVDSFLLVSGMLVSYGFFEDVTKNKRFNVFLFYVYRYIRITLPLSVAVIVYSSFIQHFGSGPLWRQTYKALQLPCQYFWWSTLLHVQNYVNPRYLCIAQTWYLSCEMLYYYFSPVILYPLWKWPTIGYINLMFFYVLSVAINFYLAWVNEYVGGMPLTKVQAEVAVRFYIEEFKARSAFVKHSLHFVSFLFICGQFIFGNQLFETRYFQRHYIAPHVRASPYLIGLGFGYAVFKTKGKKIKMNFGMNLAGWIITIIFMLSTVVGSHVFQEENHDYNRVESSLYLSCSRSAWVLGIAWIIWACVHGYGGFVNDILSLHVFRVLGRIGYGIFLFHMCLQYLKEGSAKMPAYFSSFHMLYDCFADLMIMIIIGTIFTLCFEYPCLAIEGALLKKNHTSTQIHANNN